MADRVALVSGAARGLGRAVAFALAAEGCDLFLVDVLASELETVRAELRAAGAGCEVVVADIARRDACRAAVDGAAAVFGRLDVLCNVAGIVRLERTVDVAEADFERIMSINVGGTFWQCQAALPHLLATGGNIVNVASQAGVTGSAYLAAYGASKAAVIQLTKSLAVEYRDAAIRINVVCPGGMATAMGVAPSGDGLDPDKIARFLTPRGLSQPEEVAAVIAFLASPAAQSIHGAVIVADQGVAAG